MQKSTKWHLSCCSLQFLSFSHSMNQAHKVPFWGSNNFVISDFAPYLWLSPHPVTVTTRIIIVLVGDPYKPSFATVTGRGDNPNHTQMNSKTPSILNGKKLIFAAFPIALSLSTTVSVSFSRCAPTCTGPQMVVIMVGGYHTIGSSWKCQRFIAPWHHDHRP